MWGLYDIVLLYICKGKVFSYKIRIELKFEKKYMIFYYIIIWLIIVFFIFVRLIVIVYFCFGIRIVFGGRYIINYIYECYCYFFM